MKFKYALIAVFIICFLRLVVNKTNNQTTGEMYRNNGLGKK